LIGQGDSNAKVFCGFPRIEWGGFTLPLPYPLRKIDFSAAAGTGGYGAERPSVLMTANEVICKV
jgi:hypothetical protein